MKFSNIHLVCLSLGLAALSACSDPSFKVKGSVEGADGGSVVLEKADHAGVWIAIDSTRLSSSGAFSISSQAPAAPEIYRLSYNGGYIYFPVDSIETVTVNSKAAAFSTDFTLEGSDNAKALEHFEKDLIAFAPKMAIADSLKAFKRYLYTAYLQDARGSVVSYYALTKTIGGTPLFGDDADAKYFSAVATSFREYRPADPRTPLLERTATEMRRRHNSNAGRKTVMQAREIALPELDLTDEDGARRPLSQCVGGKPTLLVFSLLNDPDAPAINARIRSAVEKKGFAVYHVGLDADRLRWRDAVKSLPWTTVYGGDNAGDIAVRYQVDRLPSFFIIDSSGRLTDRADGLDDALRKI